MIRRGRLSQGESKLAPRPAHPLSAWRHSTRSLVAAPHWCRAGPCPGNRALGMSSVGKRMLQCFGTDFMGLDRAIPRTPFGAGRFRANFLAPNLNSENIARLRPYMYLQRCNERRLDLTCLHVRGLFGRYLATMSIRFGASGIGVLPMLPTVWPPGRRCFADRSLFHRQSTFELQLVPPF